MTHADEARRIVDDECDCKGARKAAERDNVPPVLVTCVPCWRREKIAAALAAAERAGIERCDKIVQDAIEVLIGHSNIDAGGLLCDVKDAIRALLPECSGNPGELPAEPAAKCAPTCLICGGKKRVCYHADACVASQYPLPGRCIASAGECRMVPPCVVFEVDCPSCLKCANPECVNREVPSNQGGWMSPVPCPSCGGSR